MDFKRAFARLVPLFAGLTLCMYIYVWLKYPDIVQFFDNLLTYQVPLIAAHAYLALIVTFRQDGHQPCDTDGLDDYLESLALVNPGSGMPMADGMGGVDAEGNTYGTDSD